MAKNERVLHHNCLVASIDAPGPSTERFNEIEDEETVDIYAQPVLGSSYLAILNSPIDDEANPVTDREEDDSDFKLILDKLIQYKSWVWHYGKLSVQLQNGRTRDQLNQYSIFMPAVINMIRDLFSLL